jgi:hypothetical protein
MASLTLCAAGLACPARSQAPQRIGLLIENVRIFNGKSDLTPSLH